MIAEGAPRVCSPGRLFVRRLLGVDDNSLVIALSSLLAPSSQLRTVVSVDGKEPVSLSPRVAEPLKSQPPRGGL